MKSIRSPKNLVSIDDALAGLDLAERLRDEGRLTAAKRVYEENIGVLIAYLKSGVSEEGSGVDGSVLADRVKVALTDAEAIKQKLSGGGGSMRQRRNVDGNSSSTSTPSSRLSSAFSSILGIGKSRSFEDAGTQTRKDYDLAQAMAMRRSYRQGPKQRPEHDATTTNEQPGGHPQIQQPPDEYPLSRRKRSNLKYAPNDPLVQVVKEELYVDKSQLATKWDDVVGLVPAKRALQEAAILPMIRPDLYTGLRTPPKGVLLYGPPGTGKTMLVRAAANESKCILFRCTSSALTSKWHGEGEKILRTLFAVAVDAAPSIILFDEIDALLSARRGDGTEHEASRRFKTEFMVQVDGVASAESSEDGDVGHRVLVLGCSNRGT